MNPNSEETYIWIKKLFEETSKLFPDAYFHIGGDEVSSKGWNDAKMWEWARSQGMGNIPSVQNHFNKKIFPMLTELGKVPIGWDEIQDGGPPKLAVIHAWRGTQALHKATSGGYQTIFSAAYYLDGMQSSGGHYGGFPGAPNEHLVIGGEACAWSEFIGQHMLDFIVWPRLAAIAERLWSSEKINNEREMYRRQTIFSQLAHINKVGHRRKREEQVKRMFDAHVKSFVPPEQQGAAINNLIIFTSLLSPADRVNKVPTSQLEELNELLDVVAPESFEYVAFTLYIETWYLERMSTATADWWKQKNDPKRDWIHHLLTIWHKTAVDVKTFFQQAEALKKQAEIVDAVESICKVGLEMLEAKSADQLEGWNKELGRWHEWNGIKRWHFVYPIIYNPMRRLYDALSKELKENKKEEKKN